MLSINSRRNIMSLLKLNKRRLQMNMPNGLVLKK
nr:MAG TPA: hypothetical protein [Bacteriophage sp.]